MLSKIPLTIWLWIFHWRRCTEELMDIQLGLFYCAENPQHFAVPIIIFSLVFRLLFFRIFPLVNLLLFTLDMFLISSCCYTLTSFSSCSFSSVHHKLLITFFVSIIQARKVILSGFYSVKNPWCWWWWWWWWLKLLRIWWWILNVKASDVTRLDIKHTHELFDPKSRITFIVEA